MLSTQGWHEKARSICDELGVVGAYDHVRDHNPSNDLPYHNWRHINHVVVNTSRGACYHQLPEAQHRDLAVAALFHDYDHSGGVTDDVRNVSRACEGFLQWYRTQPAHCCDADHVLTLIRSTQTPLAVPLEQLSQCIMRDADLMENGLDTWHEQIMNGVRYELEVKLQRPITYEQMLAMQLEYHAGVTWNTQWGQQFAQQHIAPVLQWIQHQLQPASG